MFANLDEVFGQWSSFIPVVRVQAGVERYVRPCCASPVAVRLHWYRRRSVPCVSAVGVCPACVVPSRPFVYLGCQLERQDRVAVEVSPPRVLELPIGAWGAIALHVDSPGGLLGMRFRVQRFGGKRGRVVLDDFSEQVYSPVLSVAEILGALCRLWAVPAPRVGEVDSDWLTRVGVALSNEGHYRPAKGGVA